MSAEMALLKVDSLQTVGTQRKNFSTLQKPICYDGVTNNPRSHKMSMRFRKSIGFGPFRVNIGKTGIGVSTGVKGARVSVNSSGRVTRSVGIPGTGVRWQESEGGGEKRKRSCGCGCLLLIILAVVLVYAMVQDERRLDEKRGEQTVQAQEPAKTNAPAIRPISVQGKTVD